MSQTPLIVSTTMHRLEAVFKTAVSATPLSFRASNSRNSSVAVYSGARLQRLNRFEDRGFEDSGFKDSGFKDSGIRKIRGIRGFRDSTIQGFRDSKD
jgi:hypothetical protein